MFQRDKKLAECRQKWEKGLKVIAEHTPLSTSDHLVVLQDEEHKMFHLHRYCPFENNWDVSVDARTTDLSKVLKWSMSGGDPSLLGEKT